MEKHLKTISFVVYISSFFMPVFVGDQTMGYFAFLIGVVTYPVPWMANVFYILALAMKRKLINERLLCVTLAIVTACVTFSIHQISGIGSESEPTKVSVGFGFFFWLGSFILMTASILLGRHNDGKARQQKLPTPVS